MSNLLDWIKSLDRDKEKKGFQILKPETRQKVQKQTVKLSNFVDKNKETPGIQFRTPERQAKIDFHRQYDPKNPHQILFNIGRNVVTDTYQGLKNPTAIPSILNKRFVKPVTDLGNLLGEAIAQPQQTKQYQAMSNQAIKQADLYTKKAIEFSKAGNKQKADQYFKAARNILDKSRSNTNQRLNYLAPKSADISKAGVGTLNTILAASKPGASARTMGAGGLINYGINKVLGNQEPGAFLEGVDSAAKYAGFVNVSNPAIRGLIGKYSNVIKNPKLQMMLSKTINGLGNVAENRAIAKLYGDDISVKDDVGAFLIGFVLGGKGDEQDWKNFKKEFGFSDSETQQFKNVMEDLRQDYSQIDQTKLAQEGTFVEPPEKIKISSEPEDVKGFNTGNKVTKTTRKMFLDTKDSLKKTFGDFYDKRLAPVMDEHVQRMGDSARWAKDYYSKLEELNIKPGTKEDMLIREFQNKDGFKKVASQVGEEKAIELKNAYKTLRSFYDEIIELVNNQRKANGLSEIPKKMDFLSQIGSNGKSVFEATLEGGVQTTDAASQAIFKKQGEEATTGAIESLRDYIQYAQKAGFTDLTAKDLENIRLELSQNKDVPKEALEQLQKIENNILGIREKQPFLEGVTKVIDTLSGAKVLGKVSTLLNQLLGIPQGAAATDINFFKGIGSKEADEALKQSNFRATIKDRPPQSLSSPGAYNKFKGVLGEFLANAQEFSNDLIFKGFFEQARSSGKSFDEAVKIADNLTPKIVADRRLGMSPEIYNSYFGNILGRFTIEPTAATKRLVDSIGRKDALEVIGTLASWHLINDILEDKVYGYRPFAIEPVKWVQNFMENYQGSDKKKKSAVKAYATLFANALSTMPIANNVFNTAYSLGETTGVLPNSREVFGSNDQTWMNTGNLLNPVQGWNRNITGNKLVDVPLNIASNILPGVEQPVKTAQAAISQNRGYAETKDGSPMYLMPDSPWQKARAMMLGQSATPQAKEWFENNFAGWLTNNQERTFNNIQNKDNKLNYLKITQEGNERLNKARFKNEPKEEKKGLFKIRDKEGAKLDVSTPQLKEQEKSRIGELIQYGEPVTPEELKLYYLDDYNSMPSKTKYEQNERVEKAYEIGQKIIDNEFLSQEDKNAIYKDLETSEEELSYFKVAKDTDGDKELYVEEMVETMGDDEKLEFLLTGRTVVNDKLLVSDTLINKLVKSGEITSSQGDALKSVIFVKDNSYEGEDAIKMGDNIYKPEKQTGSGSGSGFGTGNIKKVKMPIGVKRSAPKSIKITTGSSGKPYTIKVTKPNLSKRKNWRSIKLKY